MITPIWSIKYSSLENMTALKAAFSLLALVVVAKAFPQRTMDHHRISPVDDEDLIIRRLYDSADDQVIPQDFIEIQREPDRYEVPDNENLFGAALEDNGVGNYRNEVSQGYGNSYGDVMPIGPQIKYYNPQTDVNNELTEQKSDDAAFIPLVHRKDYGVGHQFEEIDRYPRSYGSVNASPHKNMIYEESQQEYRQILPMQGERTAPVSLVQMRTLRRAWSELV